MLKILGAALVVVGLLAWSAVGRATTSEERTAPARAVGVQLAKGGGSGAHARAEYRAHEKIIEKKELKKERAAVDEAGDGVFGDDKKKVAGDAADKDEGDDEGAPTLGHHGH